MIKSKGNQFGVALILSLAGPIALVWLAEF
jgi:hypothetical protein